MTAVCAALVCCTSPGLLPGAAEPTQSLRAERTYAYGAHPRQRVAVHWHPERSAAQPRRPGVVVLHGGYWRMGRSPGWRAWCRALSDTGLVVFDVEYRRNVDARWPAQRDDILAALDWITRRSARFGLDPVHGRLVLLGASAGGHLAASVGTYGAGGRRVAGVAALSPVADPLRAWRRGADGTGPADPRTNDLRTNDPRTNDPRTNDPRTPAARAAEARALRQQGVRRNAALLAGCTPGGGGQRGDAACRSVWRDMAAVSHASGRNDAALFLVHSARDFVPPAHSRALARAERNRGMPPDTVSVRTVPGSAHGGGLLGEPGVKRALLAWIESRTDGRQDRG